MILYRPVGLNELAHWCALPPRLSYQPVFYPVLNEDDAIQIARDWNTKDAASLYSGFVTHWHIDDVYAGSFAIHTVGARLHQERWGECLGTCLGT